MKKSLLISVFATLAMMISLNAFAQEKATGKAYKAIQKDENTGKRRLQDSGWKIAVGQTAGKFMGKTDGNRYEWQSILVYSNCKSDWWKSVGCGYAGNQYC